MIKTFHLKLVTILEYQIIKSTFSTGYVLVIKKVKTSAPGTYVIENPELNEIEFSVEKGR